VEDAVLTKLREFMSDGRNKRSMQAETTRRTQKAKTNVASLEKRLGEVRAKIERGTENLAVAAREDLPGISRLLAQWRDDESQLKASLQQANGCGTPSPQAMEMIARIEQLLKRLSEADREKLAFALRQTIKRITLRRERRSDGRHRIALWDGVIELRDDLGLRGTIPLTDEDLPSPGRWHDAVAFIRNHGVRLSDAVQQGRNDTRRLFVDQHAHGLGGHRSPAAGRARSAFDGPPRWHSPSVQLDHVLAAVLCRSSAAQAAFRSTKRLT
jgi:hypothetical protein